MNSIFFFKKSNKVKFINPITNSALQIWTRHSQQQQKFQEIKTLSLKLLDDNAKNKTVQR